jgi:ELWxxDGT repeat protein
VRTDPPIENRLIALVVVAALIPAIPAFGQKPYLVKDINVQAGDTGLASSTPTDFTAANGLTFFTATTSQTGTELWVTDLTESGTHLVRDIVPGSGSSKPHNLLALGNMLLFTASDAQHGLEIWRSDGTAAGTSMVRDLTPGPLDGVFDQSSGVAAIAYHGRMYFTGTDGSSGAELWATDGTSTGTVLVSNITSGQLSSQPHAYVIVNDVLYFVAETFLFRSDGTSSGTTRVKQVESSNLTAMGSKLFFVGNDSTHGYEPWVSDGTEGGTHLIKDVQPLSGLGAWSGPSEPVTIEPFGDIVFFIADDGTHGRERWRSDGTAQGTYLLFDHGPNAVPGGVAVGDRFYIPGYPLMQTDGTVAGTLPVARNGTMFTFEPRLAYRDRLIGSFVLPGQPEYTLSLKISGTEVAEVEILPATSTGMTVIDDRLFLRGIDEHRGIEPAVSDGTAAGTRIIANVAPEGVASSNPRRLTAAGNQLFFIANDETQRLLRVSDGTAAGTRSLSAALDPYRFDFAACGNLLFFRAANGVLRQTDGTEGMTLTLTYSGYLSSTPMFAGADAVYFSNSDGYHSVLYRTDGTVSQPVTGDFFSTDAIAESGGRLYYFATRFLPGGAALRGLWLIDEGQTSFIDALGSYGAALYSSGGRLFAFSGNSSGSFDLWRSDGSAEGTTRVGTGVADSSYLTEAGAGRAADAGGRLLFAGTDKDHGEELWISDGTAAGTKLLLEIRSGFVGAKPRNFRSLNGRVVFTADDGTHAREPWVSDGTAEGTRLLRDIAPGAVSSSPAGFAAAAGRIWFQADDGTAGSEAWSTDGTPEGTSLVADVNPGAASSSAAGFVAAGSLLYFSATREAEGNELWAMPVAGRLRALDTHLAEGEGDARSAHVRVKLDPAATTRVTVAYSTEDANARAGSDYTAATGTLTFEPGQTLREIEVPITGDAVLEPIERFSLLLHDAQGAAIERDRAWISIDDDDAATDLEITQKFNPARIDIFSRVFTVTNKGPLVAREVTMFMMFPDQDSDTSYHPISVGTLEPGESRSYNLEFPSFFPAGTYRFGATVTASLPDPNPGNNSVVSLAGSLGPGIPYGWVFLGREVIAGAPATLQLIGLKGRVATLLSDRPQIVALPTTVSITSDVFDVPLQVSNGNETVGISAASTQPATIQAAIALPVVSAAGSASLSTGLVVSSPSPNFGDSYRWSARITSAAPNGLVPTGTVTFYIGANAVATGTVLNGSASVAGPILELGRSPGNSYAVRAEYSGDATFLPSSGSTVFSVANAIPTVSVSVGKNRNSPLIVTLIGAAGKTPTGQVQVFAFSVSASLGTAQLVPVPASPGIATASFPALPSAGTVRVLYAGDSYYAAVNSNEEITVKPSRTARH